MTGYSDTFTYIFSFCFYYLNTLIYSVLSTIASMVDGKPQNKSPNLLYQIYSILACLKALITYGKLSEHKIVGPVESVTGVLHLSIEIFNYYFHLIWHSINEQFKADVKSQLHFTGFLDFLSDSNHASWRHRKRNYRRHRLAEKTERAQGAGKSSGGDLMAKCVIRNDSHSKSPS